MDICKLRFEVGVNKLKVEGKSRQYGEDSELRSKEEHPVAEELSVVCGKKKGKKDQEAADGSYRGNLKPVLTRLVGESDLLPRCV